MLNIYYKNTEIHSVKKITLSWGWAVCTLLDFNFVRRKAIPLKSSTHNASF